MGRLSCVLAAAVLLAFVAAVAAKDPPRAGTVFSFSATYPRHVTCDVEFRDPNEVRWPNFFYGKPAGDGTFTYDAKAPKAAFSLLCDRMCQRNGDQGRRVLGELCSDAKTPMVTFTATSMGPFQTETAETEGKGGKKGTKQVEYAPVEGTLDVDGRKVSVKGKATMRFGYPKDGTEPDSVYMDIRFTINGTDLGLKSPGAAGPINVRVGTTAYLTKGEPAKDKPKGKDTPKAK
jgi:hypothetical protein